MSKTIQLQKLQSAKRLTLRLKEAKQSLKPPNVDDENLSDSVATMADQFFSTAETEFLSLSDAAHTEMIESRLDKTFDEMVKSLNKERDHAKSALRGLSPKQQDDLADFWEGVKDVLMDLFHRMVELFDEILVKVRAGYKIVKELLSKFFAILKQKFQKVLA